MNLQNIFTEIEQIDPEVYNRLDSRRSAMRGFAKAGGKVALAAVPLMLGGMFKKAYAGSGSNKAILGVLNFALTLEYLEAEFYTIAVGKGKLITAPVDKKGFKIIRDHEQEHVAFLTQTIMALGGMPAAKPEFDFTAQGTFPTVFSDYGTFLAVSQTFEDTGVRAYKGQAGVLMPNNDVLLAALRIHSVEARHASYVRELRSVMLNDETIRPWITNDSTAGIGAPVQASYNGEQVTNEGGVEIVGINGFDISMEDATEAFDEPLTMDAVLAIVAPFIVA